MNWKIYYNPKCGTCRKVLELMEAKRIKPLVIEYLKIPPNPDELDSILKLAGLEPEQIIRKKEKVYSELKLDSKKLSRGEWLRILSENPVLIQRPIVCNDDKAVVARPPEKVLSIL